MEFNDCIKALKRYLWLVMTVTAVAAASAWVVNQFLLIPIYQSTATILVCGQTCNNNPELNDVLLDANYIKALNNIAASDTVVQDVIDDMRLGWSLKYMRKLIDLDVDLETGIVKLSARTNDPKLSQKIVQAYTESLKDQLGNNALKLSIDIIDAPKLQRKPVSPNIVLNMFLSLAGGVMTGILIALLISIKEQSKIDIVPLRKLSSIFVMGYLPRVASCNSKNAMLHIPGNAMNGEAMKVIRTNLEYLLERDSITTVMITSPRAAEGKSSVAVNIALSMAQLNKHVLLIDCNLRKPGLYKICDRNNKTFADNSDYYRIGRYWVKSIRSLGIDLVSDSMIPRDQKSVSLPFLQSMFEAIKHSYDLILVDCPPLMTNGDTLMLSRLVENVILVADYPHLSYPILEESIHRLTQIRANILGIVINRVPPTKLK